MLRRSTLRIWSCSLVLLLLLATGAAAQPNAVVPPSFADELVTSVGLPTALAFIPDGRLLVAAQPGTLRVYQDGALLPTPALDLGPAICANHERGLLGVAIDPDFATNHFVYLYYTFHKFPLVNTCTSIEQKREIYYCPRFFVRGSRVVV